MAHELATNGLQDMQHGTTLRGRWLVALKVHIVVVSLLGPPAGMVAAWLANEAIESRSFRQSDHLTTRDDLRELERAEREAREVLKQSVDARLNSLERDTARILAILERVEASLKDRQP